MKSIYKICFILLLMMGTACDESLLEQTNPNQFDSESYYTTEDQLIYATNAIYSQLLGADLWGRMMQYFSDMRADEHAAGGAQLEVHNAQLLDGTYTSSNYPINAAWQGMYRVIHRANIVIGKSEDIEMNEALKKRLVAEAKFLRAYAYYYLNVNWGKVPIYTEVVESPNGTKAPAEESDLYTLLETDLTAIQNDLDWVYTDNDAGRANKGAAKLLLARVLMHQGKYADARTVLLDIYNNGPFELTADYYDNFKEETEYNVESIFEIGFDGVGFTWAPDANSSTARRTIMFQDYNPIGWRNAIPSDKLLNDFEHVDLGDAKTDPRLAETVFFTGDFFGPAGEQTELTDAMQNGYASNFHGTTIKTSWRKYSPMYKINPGDFYESPINYRNMRYAEVLIKLAECENEVNTHTDALPYLNELRARPSVDMPPYPTANYPCDSKEEVMRAIMHESLVEFANEKLRVLELARWRKNNKFSALNPDPIDYIVQDPSKALLPYPDSEVSRNPNF